MRRHNALRPTGGRREFVGFFKHTIFLTAAPPSLMEKSPSSPPNGRRDGRSRLVHMVRIVNVSASGKTGLEERSTKVRYMSVPSSPALVDWRRLAIQNTSFLSRMLA